MNTDQLPETQHQFKTLDKFDEEVDLNTKDDCPDGEIIKTKNMIMSFNKVQQYGYQSTKKYPMESKLCFDGKLNMKAEPDIEDMYIPQDKFVDLLNQNITQYRSGYKAQAPSDLQGVDKMITKGYGTKKLVPEKRAGAQLDSLTGASAYNGYERINAPTYGNMENFKLS